MASLIPQQAFALAMQHHQAGRLREAEGLYRQILALEPRHVDAMHMLGLLAHHVGRSDAAVDLIRSAIGLGLNQPEVHCNLGDALRATGRIEEAIAAFRTAIALNPNLAGAYINLGIALRQQGQFEQAIEACRHAIQLMPAIPEAHANLGLALHDQAQFEPAIAALRQAIALRPNYAQAYVNLGNAYRSTKQLDQSIAAFRKAIAQAPNLFEAHSNLGNVLRLAGETTQAIAAYQQAIALQPTVGQGHSNLGDALLEAGQVEAAVDSYRKAIELDSASPNAQTFNNFGNALQSAGKLDQALNAYRKAIRIQPNYPEAFNNLGNALTELGRSEEAMAAYEQSISLSPHYPQGRRNLGILLRDRGRLDEAIAQLEQAIAIDPQFAHAHWDLAYTALLAGNFRKGWKEYEWRWKLKDFPSPRREFSQPMWDGSPLNGRTILLHVEQGFGDAIQFLRYVPMVTGGRVILECPEELERLLKSQSRLCEQLIVRGQTLPEFDVHSPLLSLPMLFGTTQSSIPVKVPYLLPDPAVVVHWRHRVDSAGDALKIGLVWAGNPTFKNDKARSPRQLSLLAPLAGARQARFFSLQVGTAAGQASTPPQGMQLIDLSRELRDFSDTAALIANLDLVISSDTSVAHLAGAMGKPVWVMLSFAPDWRWQLKREDCPWYPTMRLFRQVRPGDWENVIQRIATALAGFQVPARP